MSVHLEYMAVVEMLSVLILKGVTHALVSRVLWVMELSA